MKFRDPKIGAMFDNIQTAYSSFCGGHPLMGCISCPISARNNGVRQMCDIFIINKPETAARLMGYEVIVDGTDTDAHTSSEPETKPLRDWTLSELHDYCAQRREQFVDNGNEDHECDECFFAGRGCCDPPDHFALEDKPKWTEQDVQLAEALRFLFGSDLIVKKNSDDALYIPGWGQYRAGLFPSLKPGQSARLSEIVGGAT